MLRAHQTLGNSALKMRNKTLVEYYISVMKRYSNKLLSITDIVVADAFFSTSSFEKGRSELGFYLVSRFRTRFQIEFCYRHSKQFTGLMDCQVRHKRQLDFAFNASFASLNVAKLFMKDNGMDNSMAKVKSLMFNANYTKLIFDMSRCRPNRTLISKIVKELIGWQPKAAWPYTQIFNELLIKNICG